MLNYDESENLRNGLKQKYVLQFPVYRITDKDYLVGGKCEGLKPPALEKIGLDYRWEVEDGYRVPGAIVDDFFFANSVVKYSIVLYAHPIILESDCEHVVDKCTQVDYLASTAIGFRTPNHTRKNDHDEQKDDRPIENGPVVMISPGDT